MKSIMLAIQPQWVEKILTGEKTIEVRKTAPKETPFKGYVYCTKNLPFLFSTNVEVLNGKIVAEFICNKVDEILPCTEHNGIHYPVESNHELAEIVKKACLTLRELYDYGVKKVDGCYSSTSKLPKLYGYHITDLKIYDQPKEVGRFRNPCDGCKKENTERGTEEISPCRATLLTRAPQSWQYVEELK